jgi:hypothetical protein
MAEKELKTLKMGDVVKYAGYDYTVQEQKGENTYIYSRKCGQQLSMNGKIKLEVVSQIEDPKPDPKPKKEKKAKKSEPKADPKPDPAPEPEKKDDENPDE